MHVCADVCKYVCMIMCDFICACVCETCSLLCMSVGYYVLGMHIFCCFHLTLC